MVTVSNQKRLFCTDLSNFSILALAPDPDLDRLPGRSFRAKAGPRPRCFEFRLQSLWFLWLSLDVQCSDVGCLSRSIGIRCSPLRIVLVLDSFSLISRVWRTHSSVPTFGVNWCSLVLFGPKIYGSSQNFGERLRPGIREVHGFWKMLCIRHLRRKPSPASVFPLKALRLQMRESWPSAGESRTPSPPGYVKRRTMEHPSPEIRDEPNLFLYRKGPRDLSPPPIQNPKSQINPPLSVLTV